MSEDVKKPSDSENATINQAPQSVDDITPQTPTTEEEVYGVVGTSRENKKPEFRRPVFRKPDFSPPDDLGEKDLRAYDITKICIFLVCGIWIIDFLLGKKLGGSEQTETVLDLLKYVITASLSFFFGTSVKKNGD